nr:hypothetical protein [Myxococcus sp. XM-1-1-1]
MGEPDREPFDALPGDERLTELPFSDAALLMQSHKRGVISEEATVNVLGVGDKPLLLPARLRRAPEAEAFLFECAVEIPGADAQVCCGIQKTEITLRVGELLVELHGWGLCGNVLALLLNLVGQICAEAEES